MANCTEDDVRVVIRTTLLDAEVTSLIVLADAEITARGLDTRTSDVKKLISMLITASIISMRDPASRSIGEYREDMLKPEGWRQLAEDQIRRTGELPFVSVNDPIENVDE